MPYGVLRCLKAFDQLVWPCAGRQDIKLLSVSINGKAAPKDSYEVNSEGLTLRQLPAGSFDLETEVQINPKANTSLEGLYYTGGCAAAVCSRCCEHCGQHEPGSLVLHRTTWAFALSIADSSFFGIIITWGHRCLQRHFWHEGMSLPSMMAVIVWGVEVQPGAAFCFAGGNFCTQCEAEGFRGITYFYDRSERWHAQSVFGSVWHTCMAGRL